MRDVPGRRRRWPGVRNRGDRDHGRRRHQHRAGQLRRELSARGFSVLEGITPIVPVVITGTEKMMCKGSSAILPGVARVEMLDAVWPRDFATREELMAAVRAAITGVLPEAMRPESRQQGVAIRE